MQEEIKDGDWCWFYVNLLNGRTVGPILRKYNKNKVNMIIERILFDNNFTNINYKFFFHELTSIKKFNGKLPNFLKGR